MEKNTKRKTADELIQETEDALQKSRESNFRGVLTGMIAQQEMAEARIAKLTKLFDLKSKQIQELKANWDSGMTDSELWDFKMKWEKDSVHNL